MNQPDNWVVFKIPHNNDFIYKVLGGWSGGYLYGNSWRLNSGITDVEFKDDFYIFKGNSGSEYFCHKGAYGIRMNIAHIANKLIDMGAEQLPSRTDWLNLLAPDGA